MDSIGELQRKRVRRLPLHPEGYTKATVILFNKQIAFLDHLVADIRQSSGASITRSEINRALIDLLTESNIDLTAVKKEEDLKACLKEKMQL